MSSVSHIRSSDDTPLVACSPKNDREAVVTVPTTPAKLFEAVDNPDPMAAPDSALSWEQIPRPDEVPSTVLGVERDVAELLIDHARSHSDYGHHRYLSNALIEWAGEYRDDDAPDYWRPCAFNLSSWELNTGTLEPTAGDEVTEADVPEEVTKKARTIISWTSEIFDKSINTLVGDQIRKQYAEYWADSLSEYETRRVGRLFLENAPELCNGWVRLHSPPNALVYAGLDAPSTTATKEEQDEGDEPAVAILFESGGYVRLFTLELDAYAKFTMDTCQRIEYDDIDLENRRERISNPESWAEGATDLLDHMTAITSDAAEILQCDTVAEEVYEPLEKRGHPEQLIETIQADEDSHFEPLAYDPPRNWTLESHVVGGNCDITGHRETATFTHPFFGDLQVTSTYEMDTREFVVAAPTPRHRSDGCPSRAAAYQHAQELMAVYSGRQGAGHPGTDIRDEFDEIDMTDTKAVTQRVTHLANKWAGIIPRTEFTGRIETIIHEADTALSQDQTVVDKERIIEYSIPDDFPSYKFPRGDADGPSKSKSGVETEHSEAGDQQTNLNLF